MIERTPEDKARFISDMKRTAERQKADAASLLRSAVGEWVRLVNVSDVEMKSDRVTIHVHGKLAFEPDDQTYSVVSTDGHGHGTNSISFQAYNVESCFRQPSMIVEITLYG